MQKNKVTKGANERFFAVGPAGCVPAEEYLLQTYRLRHNVLSGKVEYRKIEEDDRLFTPLTPGKLKSIVLQSKRDGFTGKEDISKDIKLYVESDDVPRYDPVCGWLKGLKWDGKDRITDFWRRIPGITAEQVYYCSVWFRSVVAQWMGLNEEHANECVPTLIGEQGCGKSTFFLRLLPKHLRGYYIAHFNLSNAFSKDLALTNNLIANLDEFDMYTAAQQAKIKQSLSETKVNSRVIFTDIQEDRKRYASFVATTNNPHPLCDVTGSRRYICIKVKKGELIDNDTPIDYDQLYAQLVYEVVEAKERHWFTNSEVKSIQKLNAPYHQVHSLEQMVDNCVRPAHTDEKSALLTSEEIISHIKEIYPNAENAKLSRITIGKVLRSLGIEKKHTMTKELYRAVFRHSA